MKKLEFHYGTMASSKSANLLMVAKNYQIQGKRVLLFKPVRDTRSQIIESRAIQEGMAAMPIDLDTDMYKLIKKLKEGCSERIHCILIDEAQFLTTEQVRQLSMVADNLDISVMAYGLLKTYIDNTLFEGSQALVFHADKLKEIKTVCYYCDRKAIMNLRLVNNKPIYKGEEVVIGDVKDGDDRYIPTCRYHYYNPEKI